MTRGGAKLRTLAALLILGGAVSLGALQNIVFVHSLGSDRDTTLVWIGLAVMSGALKLWIPFNKRWYASVVLLPAFIVAFLFDVLCAVGHGALTRGTKLDTYEAAIRARNAAYHDVAKLTAEIEAIAPPEVPAKSSAVLKSELATLRATNSCAGREQLAACISVLGPARTAIAAAEDTERRLATVEADKQAKLEQLRVAETTYKALREPTHPDQQAQWLAKALGVTERFAASIQTLLGMAIIELGVLAGAVMAERSIRLGDSVPREKPQPRARNPPVHIARSLSGADAALEVLRSIISGTTATAGITVAGNTLAGSQTAFALACGCSQPTMGRWLQDLAKAGKVKVLKQGRVTKITIL